MVTPPLTPSLAADLAVILAIDWALDRCRTAVNVSCPACGMCAWGCCAQLEIRRPCLCCVPTEECTGAVLPCRLASHHVTSAQCRAAACCDAAPPPVDPRRRMAAGCRLSTAVAFPLCRSWETPMGVCWWTTYCSGGPAAAAAAQAAASRYRTSSWSSVRLHLHVERAGPACCSVHVEGRLVLKRMRQP